LIGIDAIRTQQERALARRQGAVEAVEALIEGETTAWKDWRRSRPQEALIKELFHDVDRRSREAAFALVSGASMSLEDAERTLIQSALTRHDGNVSHAAESLGLSRSALYRRLNRYDI